MLRRILIIDDEPLIRAMLWQMLGRAGYEVEISPNGTVGLETCRTKEIDLVITDIFMPEKDGLGIIKDIHKEFPLMPIIAISGGGNVAGHPVGWLNSAAMMGVRTFKKPVDREKLLEAVHEILE
ncbi:MAG: response regulator [Thermodesulfobacteriota bacterium]|nr:response regulator [Thermodesulfobacteriota bacterium]